MLTALCLSTTDLAAQPLSLAWDAPAGCPSQAAVLQGVERIVGRPLNELAVPWMSAQGAVVRQQEGWLLQVIVVGADGTRNTRLLAAASCTEAAEAASVVLATSLASAQPNATASQAPLSNSNASLAPPDTSFEHEPAPPKSPPAVPASSPAPAARVAPPPLPARVSVVPVAPPPFAPVASEPVDQLARGAEESKGFAASLGARLGADTSLLGQPAAIAGLVGGVELRPARVRAWLSATNSVDHALTGTEGGANIALYAGGLDGCASLAGDTLQLEGCAGGQVGVLRADGYGGAGTHVAAVFWSAGQASGLLRWRRGTLGSFWLEAALVVPFRRLYVELADSRLHQTPAASGQFWLGFDLDL